MLTRDFVQDKWLQANGEGSMTRDPHFQVSMEGDAVGRTLELSWFNTYEELYSRLAAMFSVSMSQLQDCVVYRDVRGSVRRIGDEPFRSVYHSHSHFYISLLAVHVIDDDDAY